MFYTHIHPYFIELNFKHRDEDVNSKHLWEEGGLQEINGTYHAA